MSKLIKQQIILFVLLFISIVAARCQQYNFRNYTAKNGLGSSVVNNIFQDSRGYIWFATQGGGVSRFDGASFKNFTTDDGLICNNVTVVTEDKTGNIWIGTAEGVSKFDGRSFINCNREYGLPPQTVYSVLVDDKNKVWIGLREGGVRIIDGNKIDSLSTIHGLPHDRVYSILQDISKEYWINTKGGIVKYDGRKIINYNQHELLKNRFFFSMMCDKEGNIWFGGAYCGVVVFNGKEFRDFQLPEEVRSDLISGIAQDRKGNIWFATDHGLVKYSNGKFTIFSEKQGLSVNKVLSVICDYEDNVWAGTQSGGVNFFNNEAFVNYDEKDGLTGNVVNCMASDLGGDTYYLGTAGKGLFVFTPDFEPKFRVLSEIKELDDINIFSLNFDNHGLLWVGTEKGVYVLEKKDKSFKLKKTYSKINDRELVNVLKIIQNERGDHWFASYGSGVISIKNNGEIIFGTELGMPTDNIMTVYEDNNSTIWIGTLDAGVFMYNGEKLLQFSPEEGFPDKAVWAITGDKKGNVFFGTGESGLSCYDGNKIVTHTTKSGIVSNYINSLQWDEERNCLWVGSEKGTNIIKFTDDFKIEKIRAFREQEGFKAFEINQNAILLDKDIVWFGSVNGLCSYNSKEDVPVNTPPKLQITEIKLGYKSVDWLNFADTVNSQTGLPVNLKLSYRNNHLVFDFRALTTDDVKYQFMLEGQDEDWSPLSRNTEANYSNITPGKGYTFKLKGMNSNGVWSDETVSFSFFIQPPWWTTWWFRTIATALIIILITIFIKTREKVLRDQNVRLENTVKIRTAEVVQQKEIVEEKNKQITDSIEYAKRIQTAILPPDKLVKEHLKNSFILYLPKDIVAGDFYWMETVKDMVLFAACDCTGHGVPGAMVSVMCHNALNRAVREYKLKEPAEILDKVVDLVEDNFTKSEDEIQDGMDASLCAYFPEQQKLKWAGANNPLWIIRNGEITEYKPDKQPIGKYEYRMPYTNHEIELEQGDTFYIFSDGYQDQFGDGGEKKLTKKGMRKILLELQGKPMDEQRAELLRLHNQWKGQVEQIDDICVIGVRV